MIRAVVFDLRDTVIRVDRAYARMHALLRRFMRERGANLTQKQLDTAFGNTLQRVKKRFDTDVHDWNVVLLDYIFEDCGLRVPQKTMQKFLKRYDRVFVANAALYPDAKSILKLLRKRGLKLGVVIDGTRRRERALLKRLKLNTFFDAAVISEDVGVNKFTPVPLATAIQRLKIPPREILVVGDRIDKDIVHANRLGCISVKLERPGGRYTDTAALASDERPRHIVHSLSEITLLLDR